MALPTSATLEIDPRVPSAVLRFRVASAMFEATAPSNPFAFMCSRIATRLVENASQTSLGTPTIRNAGFSSSSFSPTRVEAQARDGPFVDHVRARPVDKEFVIVQRPEVPSSRIAR